MSTKIAHKFSDKERTTDVEINDNVSFSKMMLSENVLTGMKKSGYRNPSPIQLKSIPLGLNGMDLIIQAKSGTGKTLVFSTIILELFSQTITAPQSLVLAPTREIAVQIESVISAISCATSGFKVGSFIGGLDVKDDRMKIQNCRSIIGTPGRILHLIKNNILNVNEIKILVLDEADKLLQPSFLSDVNKIYKTLNNRKQMIVASATYDNNLEKILASYMKNPVSVTPKKEAPILLGVKQFVHEIPIQKNSIQEMFAKVEELKQIFKTVNFKQCLAFSSSQSRAESYCNYLVKCGWPSEVITGAQDQLTRLNVLRKLKEFKCRILISTDLCSRGIDAENVNLIINLEAPTDPAVYLHRIGRAGRFGSHGISITFINSENEMIKFRKLLGTIGGSEMSVLKFPIDNVSELWNFEKREDEKLKYGEVCGLIEQENDEELEQIPEIKSNLEVVVKLDIESVKNCKNGRPMDEIKSKTDIQIMNERLLNITSSLIDQNSNDSNEILNVFQDYNLGNSNETQLTGNNPVPIPENSCAEQNYNSDSIKRILAGLKVLENGTEKLKNKDDDSEENNEIDGDGDIEDDIVAEKNDDTEEHDNTEEDEDSEEDENTEEDEDSEEDEDYESESDDEEENEEEADDEEEEEVDEGVEEDNKLETIIDLPCTMERPSLKWVPVSSNVISIPMSSSSSKEDESSTDAESDTTDESNITYKSESEIKMLNISEKQKNKTRFRSVNKNAQKIWNRQYLNQLNIIQNHIQLCRNSRQQGYY